MAEHSLNMTMDKPFYWYIGSSLFYCSLIMLQGDGNKVPIWDNGIMKDLETFSSLDFIFLPWNC